MTCSVTDKNTTLWTQTELSPNETQTNIHETEVSCFILISESTISITMMY